MCIAVHAKFPINQTFCGQDIVGGGGGGQIDSGALWSMYMYFFSGKKYTKGNIPEVFLEHISRAKRDMDMNADDIPALMIQELEEVLSHILKVPKHLFVGTW